MTRIRDGIYARLPDQLPGQQRRGPSPRTIRRQSQHLREALTAHMGGKPNEIEKALISQCCVLHVKCKMMEKRIKHGEETELDHKTYLSWTNSYRRYLAALNYGEVAKIIRHNAEAKLLREYSR
jgi:hypothetical protein